MATGEQGTCGTRGTDTDGDTQHTRTHAQTKLTREGPRHVRQGTQQATARQARTRVLRPLTERAAAQQPRRCQREETHATKSTHTSGERERVSDGEAGRRRDKCKPGHLHTQAASAAQVRQHSRRPDAAKAAYRCPKRAAHGPGRARSRHPPKHKRARTTHTHTQHSRCIGTGTHSRALP